ncbi:FecR domain-containing protein [Aureimonas sp. ME7]|uniref:FecR family protein n=1 Tax=Aureimonas sp. ME7 TaxID=2744252 RepID=UPI001FCEA000|nr:FecR domain-containing protein [Aureimonas sp. ME7]
MPRPLPSRELSDEALLFLVRLHSGENEDEARQSFAAWRALGPEHEAAASEAEALWADAGHVHRDPASGRIHPGRRRARLSRRQILGGAAGIAVAGFGAGVLRSVLTPYLADLATGTGETRVVELPDGSRATLNARTALDLSFDAAARIVELLEGQAFFEVAPDPARPFEVRRGASSVRALGTAFDVDAALPGGALAIGVAEHSVRVAAGGAGEVLVLQEGERVVVGGDGRIGAVSRGEREAVAAWRSGIFTAQAQPLGEVVAALRAYYPGWVVVRGEALARLPVNAVLDLRRPGASLDALAAGLPIRVRRLSGVLTIIDAP